MERMEIHGRCGMAIAYAKVIEEEAIEQIRRMCDYEFTEGVRIRIMPDVHWGKGCTIVGVDIGCGMYTVSLGKGEIDFARFDEAAHFVPSGRDVWEGRHEKFDLLTLHCYRALKDTKRVARSLGTLGGGNHFIEIDRSADGTNYLVIHTGSRNLGKQVAEYYQNIAIDLSHGKDELFRARDELIRRYKEEGRRSELQGAIMELYRSFEAKAAEIPADLAYLYGSYLEDYLHDIEICQAFARKNREVIARILLERTGLTAGEAFHTIHNYIDTEERILRKGAIAAHAGERVLIPINMRDGSILAVGRGSADWNYSAPHGAGRIMSRKAAKETLSMDEFRKTMTNVYTTAVNKSTLDEAPMAYKSLADIIDVIADSVDVIEVLKPIYNFKAG